jgi:hypothetical protein
MRDAWILMSFAMILREDVFVIAVFRKALNAGRRKMLIERVRCKWR